jgi:CobQ-like glutamine amidotransferase family enzyme
VGELLADIEPWDGAGAIGLLTGFENHASTTVLGPGAVAFGTVRHGVGNGDGTEGARAGRVIGTYCHGPVLARNPALADLLLGWAVGETLAPLDDGREEALRLERIDAARRAEQRQRRRARSRR